jgi:hypothetical protein
MSWEAFRLTSKSPSEVLTVLGPHGVDELIREAISDCWREHPEQTRTFASVRQRVEEVFERNMRVWGRINKPAPGAFFEHLLPHAADGHIRQALVLCWMMLPRAGGRKFGDVAKVVRRIYERNLAAWEQDHLTFTGAGVSSSRRGKTGKPRSVPKRAVKKKVTKKRKKR